MLNTLSVSLMDANADGVWRAADAMARQGFAPALRLSWEGGVVEAWGHPSQRGATDSVVRAPAGEACCVGPLWYRGQFGEEALRLLIAEVADGAGMDETELRGNYALFIRTHDRCLLLNDAPGCVRVYSSSDGMFHSSSWLATCAYAGNVELDEAAAIQYVLLGASHSTRTAARGITTLPLGIAIDLERGHPRVRRSVGFDGRAVQSRTIDEAVERISAHLRTVFGEAAAAFPGRVRMALSGGFDSRLILAGLLAADAPPELFVYGGVMSEDVRIARQVAQRAQVPLAVVDKAAQDRRTPPFDLDRLRRNALFFDGLPTDGVLDAGSDRSTRLQQTADGWLAMNGGGGEIYRNFFHLPDRPFHAIDVVRAFYGGFDRAVFRHPAEFDRYQDRMVASMEQVLDVADGGRSQRPRGRLSRGHVELLYPLFRCHYWMGVNNSIAVRHGYYTTPLVDPTAVRLSSWLPLSWKNAGLLEARLITRLDPGVAGQPSAHGFRFSDGPDRRARMDEWAMGMRPTVLRPMINALRRKVHGTRVTAGKLTELRQLLPGEWQIDPWLDLARLPDEGALRRALSLEVVWRLALTA